MTQSAHPAGVANLQARHGTMRLVDFSECELGLVDFRSWIDSSSITSRRAGSDFRANGRWYDMTTRGKGGQTQSGLRHWRKKNRH